MTPTVASTVGVFDGFHRGHAAVVDRARRRADRAHAQLVVFTFDPHPDVVLGKGTALPKLTLLAEKIRHLREAGADEVRVIRFSPELAAKSPGDFLRDHVFPFYRLAVLVVGYDFAMGRDRKGTIPVLRRLGTRTGFELEVVEAAEEGGEVVSSTQIRADLLAGRVEEAKRGLGTPYSVTGAVVRGDGRGRKLGFPTANLDVSPDKLKPARGVYVVRAGGGDLEGVAGVVNVGRRPTFGESAEVVEAHLLDLDTNLRGKAITIEFLSRLRPEVKFNDINELKQQIQGDVDRARDVIAAGDAASIDP
jgi:riboflavin kinase/FMN adenylyltransferase